MTSFNLSEICPFQSSLADIYAQVSHSGKITLTARYGLRAALLDHSLTEDEQNSIDRMLRGVRRGYLKIVDEL